MTSIRFKHTVGSLTLKMDGHADFAKSGKDIVCAGISAITSLLLIATRKAERAKEIKCSAYEVESGHINISFVYLKPDSNVRPVVDIVLEGLASLSRQYPENVQLEAV